MSTTAEMPAEVSLGEAAKNSKQVGLVSMEQRMAEAMKAGSVAPVAKTTASTELSPEPESKVEKSLLSKVKDMEKDEVKKEVKSESPKAADWKKVNEDREALRKEKEELANRLKELETSAVKPERLKELEEQVNKLHGELEVKAFERSEAYQNKFVKPINGLIEQLHDYAKVLELDPSVVDQALSLHGKQRLDFVDEHFGSSTSAVAAISQALFQLDHLNKEKDSALNLNREQMKALMEEEARQRGTSEKAETEAILKAFESRKTWAAEKLPHFRENGDESHNKQVQENLELAKALITGTADPEDIAAAPYLAVAARSAIQRASVLEKENFDLRARLAEYTSNEPTLGSGDKTSSNNGGKPMGILAKMGIRD